MDKETSEWARIVFPKTLEWRLVKWVETMRNLFYWWKPQA